MDAKKNVTIEVRLSDVTKAAFMARCRAEGRSASDAIRGFIDVQLAMRPAPMPRILRRGALIWAIGLAFGTGMAAPSLARPERQAAPSFAHLDRNHDGVIDRREYSVR